MEEKIYKQMEEIVMRYFINKNQFRLSSYRDENDYLDPHYLYYRDVELTYNRLDEEEKILPLKISKILGVLEIPKINLKRGLSQNKYYNNVNRNVEILKGSTMPNVSKGNFILAGHSGSGRVAFFRNLDKLTIGDISYIYYGGIKYTYKVNNIYDIEKTGTATITRDLNKTTLTMITCRHNTNKQIVIISELINQESY